MWYMHISVSSPPFFMQNSLIEIFHPNSTFFHDTLSLSKFYFIVAMLKFPVVISRNGILNGIISILFLGLLSSISNLLIAKILNKSDTKSFLDISKKLLGTSHDLVVFIVFVFRCISLFYLIDLSHRLLLSFSSDFIKDFQKILPDFLSKYTPFLTTTPFFLSLLFLFSYILIPNPNLYFTNSFRNTFTLFFLFSLTSIFAYQNFYQNFDQINFFNHSENYFDSLPLTLLCFTQQLGNSSVLSLTSSFQCIFSGIIHSLAYIFIGITGYLSYTKCDLNWCQSLEIFYFRIFSSLIFLILNILQFSVAFNLIKIDLKKFFRIENENNTNKRRVLVSFLCSTILIIFLTFFGLKAVASSYLSILCLIFSILVMLVIPSLFYIKSKQNSNFKKLLAYGCIVIGGGLVFNYIYKLV